VNDELIEYLIKNDSGFVIKIIPISSKNFRDSKKQNTIKENEIYT